MSPLAEPGPALDALIRDTIDACIEVHRWFGPGLLESVYEEALCVELERRQIRFARQVAVEVKYKSSPVGVCRLDLVVAGQLVVELKSVPNILPIHVATMISYLKAFHQPLGIIINFNAPVLLAGVRRVVHSSLLGEGNRQDATRGD
jgi:GxxExxY protein